MAVPLIEAFWFDEINADKFAAHGVSERQVAQVLGNEHVVIPNRRRRRARYLVIGTDNGGACLAIPIEPTGERGVWRPITAWRCKDVERDKLS